MDATGTPAETAAAATRPKPLWKRVLQFPLVALILAVVLMVTVQAVAAGISYVGGTSLDDLSMPTDLVFAVAVTVLMVLAYKLVVVRMGAQAA